MYLLHVEDDDLKARAVDRALRRRLATACAGTGVRASGLDTVRARTLEEGLEVLASRPDLLITDWAFPRAAGGAVDREAGALMVAAAEARGVPWIVVSGSLVRPGYDPERWVDVMELWDRVPQAVAAALSRGAA